MTEVNYHILRNEIAVNFDGKVVNVERDSDLGRKVIAKIKAGDLVTIPAMIDTAEKLKHISNELFVIEDGALYSYGELVPNWIAGRVMEFMEEELPFEYLLNFWNNLKKNPSDNSRKQLFGFLEANHFAITQDGHFIAYKKVASDFMDDWTGTMDNSVGKVVEMPREAVVDDPSEACSAGLHIAPYSYAKSYKRGGKLIELKVNPRDVVSVPHSYEHQKARACKYLVVGIGDVNDGGIKDTVVKGEKYDAPVDVIVQDVKCDVVSSNGDPSKEQNYIVEGSVAPDVEDSSNSVGFIDPSAEAETLDKTDIEEVELAVKDDGQSVLKALKLGNFNYIVVALTTIDYKRLSTGLVTRKKSRWAKAFTDTWKKDITKIERFYNDISEYYEYVIHVKNGSMFYATVKQKK